MSKKDNKPVNAPPPAVTEDPTPAPVVNTAAAPQPQISAADYLQQELVAARAELKNTQIYGTLIVLVIAIYIGVITGKFISNLKPAAFTEILTGQAQSIIDDHRADVISNVRTQVPAMIQKAPDIVKEKLPEYSTAIKTRFSTELNAYCDKTQGQLEQNIASYVDKNKDSIKKVLDLGNDPEAVSRELGPALHATVMDYLKEKPADGESIAHQLNESLAMFQSAEKRLQKLADGKSLTAPELKARRAIAVIANTVDEAELKPVTLPQFDASAADDESAPAPAGKPVAKPAAGKPAAVPAPKPGAPAPAPKAGAAPAAVKPPAGAPPPGKH